MVSSASMAGLSWTDEAGILPGDMCSTRESTKSIELYSELSVVEETRVI